MELDLQELSDLTNDFAQSRGSVVDRMIRIWKIHQIPIGLSIVCIISIIIAIVLFIKSTQSMSPILFSENSTSAASASGQLKGIFVDIEGAVVNPGVYELPMGSRIDEALQKAGGFRSDADLAIITKTINRASKLVDGAKIYIPKTGESTVAQNVGKQSQTATNVPEGLVSVNSATQAQLETLAGIGPATAIKIISNRPYQTLEELIVKKAMGQSLFNKLKEQITL